MHRSLAAVLIGLLPLAPVCAADTDEFPKPEPNSPKEAMAKTVSLEKAGSFLDAVAVNWTTGRKCATCHTNVAYLMAAPALGAKSKKATGIVRDFFEQQVARWEDGKEPRNDSEVVAIAAALALHDAGTTGKLHERTRQALDRMWQRQGDDGAWDWEKCGWPPLEHDDYYGAVLAAIAAGTAPGDHAKTDQARKGLEKLRDYLKKNKPPTLHHKAMLLWASQKVDGVMTAAVREETIKALLAKQRDDGGWSLPSLGDWKGFDGRPNDLKAPSDGYATGFVVFVLRQAGVPADREPVKKGVAWLKANQRASGRWFTQSLNTDRAHYISHAGTAFAVLALKACEQ